MEDEIAVPEGAVSPLYVCSRPEHLIEPRVDVMLTALGDHYTGDYEPAALISGGLCPFCPGVRLRPGPPCRCCGAAQAECPCCGSYLWAEGTGDQGEWGVVPGPGLVPVDEGEGG